MSELTKRLRDIPINLRTVVHVHYLATFTKHEQAPTMNTLDAGIAAHEAADRIDALEECLLECADDLECELDARYPQSVRAYACMESDYQRDMSPVYKARALLEEK